MVTDLRPSERRGEPTVAVLVTWFLPGAGHVYLGRLAAGLLAFLAVEGLYVLGWLLSDGRTFEFLDPELRGALSTVLTPELGNLGGMLAQLKVVGFGAADPLPYPGGILLGGWLTALSGFANVLLMVHAHLLARTPAAAPRAGISPVLAVAAAWLLPGLGHLLQGRRRRALVVFALLFGFFLWGTWLAEGSNLSRERHFYYWSGQFLLGVPAFLAEVLTGRPPVTGELPRGDVGLLFACMPGLLNVLAMLDVHGVGERRWLGTEAAA
ncbi:MAG: DUF6677 family protein [Planctomycetota bacterium]